MRYTLTDGQQDFVPSGLSGLQQLAILLALKPAHSSV